MLPYCYTFADTPLSSSTHSLVIDNTRNNVTRKDHSKPVAVEISMTTCSKCHSCNSLMFDEEIMAGWTAEDSNLNTRCHHCKKWAVPFMEVTLTDYRYMPLSQMFPMTSASSVESMHSTANPSRRPSVINPSVGSTSGQTGQKSQEKKGVNNEIKETVIAETSPEEDDEAAVAEVDSALEKKDELTLDPLGVIEELQRSRRNSPDPNECDKETSSSQSENVPQPGTTEASSYTNTLVVTSHHHQPPQAPQKVEGVSGDPILVPYLSPLVLRKELENVLDHEGDTCLVQPKFVDEHPIIYWNLVWFFHRANLTSHIKGLCLNAKTVLPNKKVSRRKEDTRDDNKSETSSSTADDKDDTDLVDFSVHPSWETSDHRNVLVRCRWDNSKFHAEYGTPLYVQWLRNKEREGKDKDIQKDGENEERPTTIDNNLIK